MGQRIPFAAGAEQERRARVALEMARMGGEF
jgi:hypothetical protein